MTRERPTCGNCFYGSVPFFSPKGFGRVRWVRCSLDDVDQEEYRCCKHWRDTTGLGAMESEALAIRKLMRVPQLCRSHAQANVQTNGDDAL